MYKVQFGGGWLAGKGSPAAHVKGLLRKREGFAGGSREGLAAQA